MTMDITMHGAGQEVGRSCIEVQWFDRRLIFDCGIKIGSQENEYPTPIKNPENIDAFFLSHAHMDHTGALPLLYHWGLRCPIFTNNLTKEITKVLLKDSWKIDRINKRTKIYDKSVIHQVLRQMRNSSTGTFKGIQYQFINAGHIPGASSILLTYKGQTLLYSGDISGTPTHLIPKHAKMPKADVLIVESTYGNRHHASRPHTEKEFKQIVSHTLDQGGSVLVAAFAVGRSQEMLLLLDEMTLKCPVYLDGMSRQITRIFLKYPQFLRNNELQRVAQKVKMVRDPGSRFKIIKQQGVFVATSGMLDGGPILGYLKTLGKKTQNALILTGYQGDDTNGRRLLDHGYVIIDGKDFDVECPVHHLDFSGHAGEDALHNYIKMVNPNVLITNHGQAGSAKSLAAFGTTLGCKSFSPKTGESLHLSQQHIKNK